MKTKWKPATERKVTKSKKEESKYKGKRKKEEDL